MASFSIMEKPCQATLFEGLKKRRKAFYIFLSVTFLQFIAFAAFATYYLSSSILPILLHSSESPFHLQGRFSSDPVSPLAPASELPSALNTSTNGNVTNPLPSTNTEYPSLSRRRIIALAISLPLLVIFITSTGIYWVLRRPARGGDTTQTSWNEAIGRLESVAGSEGPTLADWRGKRGSEKDSSRRKSSTPTLELINDIPIPSQERLHGDGGPRIERPRKSQRPRRPESPDIPPVPPIPKFAISKPSVPLPCTPPDQLHSPAFLAELHSAESTPEDGAFVTAPQSPSSGSWNAS